MSLIQVRRERKFQMQGGPSRPPRIWMLIAGLIIVLFLIWKLSSIG